MVLGRIAYGLAEILFVVQHLFEPPSPLLILYLLVGLVSLFTFAFTFTFFPKGSGQAHIVVYYAAVTLNFASELCCFLYPFCGPVQIQYYLFGCTLDQAVPDLHSIPDAAY